MVAKKKKCTYLNSHHTTLDSHCTRAAQLLHGGCSQQVHKIVYLAVKKGFILVKILPLKIFILIYCHYPAVYLLNTFFLWIE